MNFCGDTFRQSHKVMPHCTLLLPLFPSHISCRLVPDPAQECCPSHFRSGSRITLVDFKDASREINSASNIIRSCTGATSDFVAAVLQSFLFSAGVKEEERSQQARPGVLKCCFFLHRCVQQYLHRADSISEMKSFESGPSVYNRLGSKILSMCQSINNSDLWIVLP